MSNATAFKNPLSWYISGLRLASVTPVRSVSVGAKQTLYDIPVSNHGARVRMLIYGRVPSYNNERTC
eukprot:1387352-Amorphochlora_amoeboformis.AAC.3